MRRAVVIFVLFPFVIYSQEGVFEPGNPCAGLLPLKEKPAVAYHYLRECDIAWEKRVWREIDLREKMNMPLYYPVETNPCRQSLFQLLKAEIMSGRIRAFVDENFTVSYTKEEVKKRLVSTDSLIQYMVDAEGNTSEQKVQVIDSTSIYSRVLKYRIKEDWIFNRQSSSLEVRIVALAAFEWVEDKEAWKELFWVYFPACRNSFARTGAFNYANDSEQRSFDEVFIKRMFSSVVVKESNVFDRYIHEYQRGIDALTESDKIKMDIFTWEHDLWHY